MTRFTNQFLLTTSGITGKEGGRERERDRFTHSVGVDSHQSRGKEADEVCSAHLVLTLVVYHSERETAYRAIDYTTIFTSPFTEKFPVSLLLLNESTEVHSEKYAIIEESRDA